MFNAKLNPCMLVMPHLLSISTSEASTAEQLAAKRDNEFIIALPEVEPHHNPIHNHNHNHNPNHHPNHNPNPDLTLTLIRWSPTTSCRRRASSGARW